MATRKEVKRYTIDLAARLKGFNEWQANIYLYGDTGPAFGNIRFTDTFVHDNLINLTGISTMWAPLDAYTRILDLLRNEKPLYLWLYDSGPALLSTSAEPVGEEES
jgi:hypothetical protein